jgi:hypothetical protein
MNNPANTQIGCFQVEPLIAWIESYTDPAMKGVALHIEGLHCLLTIHADSPQVLSDFAASVAEAVCKHQAKQFAALPVTDQVNLIGEHDDTIEMKQPLMEIVEEDPRRCPICHAIHAEPNIHPQLPPHLRPKRKPIWERFEQGYVPGPLSGDGDNFEEYVEYQRWQMATGGALPPEGHASKIPF